jgi:hypothetical protein
VLLTSYIRPELTNRSLERIIAWDGLKKLIVVIDGLRPNASETEKAWRNSTIKVVEDFQQPEKMELWCYGTNVGITEHYLRLQERVMDQYPDTIWVEEDIDLNFKEFINLETKGFYESGPLLISGYSHFDHSNTTFNELRGNLFVPMWGLRMNVEFHQLICRVWRDKKFNEKVVEDILTSIFPTKTINQRMYLKSVISYWTNYSKWSLTSLNRWDSLANYSLWTQGRVSLTSMNRLADDCSYLDYRGMNQRNKPNEVVIHEPIFKESMGIKFCLQCEFKGSRKDPRFRSRIGASFKYRIRKKCLVDCSERGRMILYGE